jgi:Pam16
VEKGGSFYVQSKVYRAKEMLDQYIAEKKLEEKEEREKQSVGK